MCTLWFAKIQRPEDKKFINQAIFFFQLFTTEIKGQGLFRVNMRVDQPVTYLSEKTSSQKKFSTETLIQELDLWM